MDRPQLDVDLSPVKIGTVCALSVVLAIIAGYLAGRIAGGASDLAAFVLFAVAVIVWVGFSALKAFIVKSLKFGLVTSLLEAGAIWAFLPGRFSPFAVAAALIVFFSLASGFVKARRDLNDRLKVRFWNAGGAFARSAMTGLALAGTIAILGSFGFPEIAIPKGVFEFAFVGSDQIIDNFIPGFSSKGSVDEVLRNFAVSQLPQGTPEAFISQSVAELKRAIEKSTGIALSGRERVMDALYDLSAGKLAELPPVLKLAAMIVIGLLIFGLAKTAAFILNWFAVLFAYLIYQLLMAFNFMHIVYENRGKEVIIVD